MPQLQAAHQLALWLLFGFLFKFLPFKFSCRVFLTQYLPLESRLVAYFSCPHYFSKQEAFVPSTPFYADLG